MDPGAAIIGGALFDLGLHEAFGAPPASPLIIDLDGDGIELVSLGDSEVLFDLNVDGYAELTVIDAADAAFSALAIWRDLDSDGVTDAGELQSLSSHSISSIDLGATAIQETNEGNLVSFRSHVSFANGATADIDDVFFSIDTRVSAMRLPNDFAF